MKAVAFSVVCPSFELASKLLEEQGLSFDAKQLSRLSEHLSDKFLQKRVTSTMKDGETLAGKRVLITADGGRSRQRKKKRGRKAKSQKRNGYYSNWIEPKLLVILVLDENGEVERKIAPHVDGTIEIDDFIQLLEDYLKALQIEQAREVFVCGDGAPWIWKRIPALLLNLGVLGEDIHEILDYTHAKQNLNELYEMMPKKAKPCISIKQWKDWLWKGEIGKIRESILAVCKNGGKKALNKFTNYFEKNQHRMTYENFQNLKYPCGSGVVESAIRRVINLRIKSCGSFWKREKLVAMIYLRAQLLYGRWDCLFHNLLKTI